MAIAELVVNIVAGTADFQRGMKQLDKQLMHSAKKVTQAGVALSKFSLPIAGVGFLATKAAIEFESAFAGVKKTVDGTDAEFKILSDGLKKMAEEIPVSTTELAKIAEAAGQLGIKKENILGFTRVMADMGVATNLSSDQAATALARMANITGMSQDKFSNLGSVVVALGNKFATTESEIVEMGLRLAGAGEQIGLSEAEIMGFSSALSSVGIEAEAGGSAFSKVMKDISKAVSQGGSDLDEFAKIAGMSAEKFATDFTERPAESLTKFIEGFIRVKQEGGNALLSLDAVGLSGIRTSDALLRTANAGTLVADSIKLAGQAWKDDNALSYEAGERYKTLESQLLVTKGILNNAAIEIGGHLTPIVVAMNEKVRDAIRWFQGLSDKSKEIIVKVGLVIAALGPLVFILGTLSSSTLNAIRGFTELGKISVGLITNIGKLWTAFVGLVPAIYSAVAASLAFLATPLGLGLALISAAVLYLITNWDDFKAGVGIIIDWFSGAISDVGDWIGEVFRDNAPEFLKTFLESASEIFSGVIEVATTAVNAVADLFKWLGSQIVREAGEIVKTWQWVTGQVNTGTVSLTAKQEAWIQKAKDLNMTMAQYKEHLRKTNPEIKETAKAIKEANKATEENNKVTNNNIATSGRRAKAESEAEKQTRKATEALKKENEQLAELSEIITGKASPEIENFKSQLQELIDTNPDKAIEDLNEEIIELAKKGLEAGISISEIKKQVEELKKTGGTGEAFDLFKNVDLEQMGANAISDIFNGMEQGFNSEDWQQTVGEMGGQLGSAIGSAFGPIGASAGKILGEEITENAFEGVKAVFTGNRQDIRAAIDNYMFGLGEQFRSGIFRWTLPGVAVQLFDALMGDKNVEANARDAVTRFFNDAIKKAKDLGYEMQQFTNLGRDSFDPFVNAAGEKTTIVTEKFKTLSAESQALFLDMGTALGTVFEIPDLDSGQFGQLLALNFGMGENSLLDLQIAVEQMGLTAESAGQKVEETYLKGQISASEFVASNRAITELFSEGIPGALGDTNKAFSNFKEKGITSGTAAIKTLGSIGAEAIEKLDAAGNRAIKSLSDLRTDLIKSGHGVQDVDLFMQALASNGIQSLEDLKNASTAQAGGIVANLESTAFGFDTLKTSVQEVKRELDEVKSKKIEIQVDFKANYQDQSIKNALQNDNMNVTPSRLGNVFQKGAVKQFAKGGVISKMTAFDIGTMAEQGPEAIMPLERLADGRLGVLSASSGSENININIDARGAEIGFEKRIVQTIENWFDRRNRLMGSRA